MIDPTKITNYNLTVPQLEETILWWVCAAGKKGIPAAKALDKLLNTLFHEYGGKTPFEHIRYTKTGNLAFHMKESGIGNYTQKSNTFHLLAASNLNLQTCSLQELLSIKGIGPKTARAFLVHSRPNQKVAALDTHLLKFLRHQGIMAPKSTPPSGKKYFSLESAFISICDLRGLSYADTDLAIWNHYRQNPTVPFDIESYTNDYHQFCTIGCSC